MKYPLFEPDKNRLKGGRVFGGFYCTDNIDHAIQYANMCQGIPAVYNVTLRENVKSFSHSGDITRLSEGYINSLLSEGYEMVIGKDIRGRIEYVIIDKSALKKIER